MVHSPAFFSKSSPEFLPVLAVANTGSSVGLQNKIGHLAGRMQVPLLSVREIFIGSKTCVIIFVGLCSEIVGII